MKLLRFETRWCGTIGRSMIPIGSLGGLTDGRDVGAETARKLVVAPWPTAIVVRLAIWLVWLAPIFFGYGARTFHGLDEERREALLERLLKSDSYAIRQMSMLLKLNVCFALMSDVKVLTHIGAYDLARRPGGLVSLGDPSLLPSPPSQRAS